MTESKPQYTRKTERKDSTKAVAEFWKHTDRYHDLAERFGGDIVITHPESISGRHPGCPGRGPCCGWCASNVTYYERVPKARLGCHGWK